MGCVPAICTLQLTKGWREEPGLLLLTQIFCLQAAEQSRKQQSSSGFSCAVNPCTQLFVGWFLRLPIENVNPCRQGRDDGVCRLCSPKKGCDSIFSLSFVLMNLPESPHRNYITAFHQEKVLISTYQMDMNMFKCLSQHWIFWLSFHGMTFHWPVGKGLLISPQGHKYPQLKNWDIFI